MNSTMYLIKPLNVMLKHTHTHRKEIKFHIAQYHFIIYNVITMLTSDLGFQFHI